MSEGIAPRDTLTVVGGRPLARVDADTVLGAAMLLGDAADGLRSAATSCSSVAGRLRRSLWVPDPQAVRFAPTLEPGAVAARARAADLTDEVAARLGRRGERADQIASRLRLAAGLYRRAESAAEQVAGALTTAAFGALGRLVDAVVLTPARLTMTVADALVPDMLLLEAGGPGNAGGDPAPPTWSRPSSAATRADIAGGGALASGWRGVARYADEAVAGLAWGVSPSGGVTGSAGDLAGLVHAVLPDADVAVLPLPDAGAPTWSDRPTGTVAEALARTADLYPQGSGIVGRPGTGAPEGTVAVEKVIHDDGSTSWTVLVPGTQALLAAGHPFDGLTDLELMAQQTAGVSQAVVSALDQAGAAPDEPVVLVGHSLGGIAAVALASSPQFLARHRVGGVVTAGSPTATFTTPRGVPVLHLENDEELVSPLDGRSSAENPATSDRVTVGRALGDSADPADRAASGSVPAAHAMPTHLRTLAAAQESQNVQVADVVGRLERLLDGRASSTGFFAVRRAVAGPGVVLAPGPDGFSPSSGRTLRRSPAGSPG